MKIHPRHVPVEEARRKLLTFLSEWAKKHDLTSAEKTQLLAEVLLRDADNAVRWERREER